MRTGWIPSDRRRSPLPPSEEEVDLDLDLGEGGGAREGGGEEHTGRDFCRPVVTLCPTLSDWR